jgi:hypothetical protein|tara:strand:- start:288 stop:500 length:213 start_codon:yes stop_codon:yes gene_type:complete
MLERNVQENIDPMTGSENSLGIVDWSVGMAVALQANVTLVSVIDSEENWRYLRYGVDSDGLNIPISALTS